VAYSKSRNKGNKRYYIGVLIYFQKVWSLDVCVSPRVSRVTEWSGIKIDEIYTTEFRRENVPEVQPDFYITLTDNAVLQQHAESFHCQGEIHPDHWACEVSVSHLSERQAYASAEARSRWMGEIPTAYTCHRGHVTSRELSHTRTRNQCLFHGRTESPGSTLSRAFLNGDVRIWMDFRRADVKGLAQMWCACAAPYVSRRVRGRFIHVTRLREVFLL
jgi:hypothetical protein